MVRASLKELADMFSCRRRLLVAPSGIYKAGCESSAELGLKPGQLLSWGVDVGEGDVEDAVNGDGGAGSQSMPRLDGAKNASPCS